ncbi:pathogenesis-related protein 1A-like [Gossypium australe]|uniref:Pathogenesis-related protein 1A-like n=1 Tax=Gossypium australe TaxID=47621 RepID=A0A5B6VI81_9ROSI|nr:pathogenesis-related protein 1A-like [Gossypium australe]
MEWCEHLLAVNFAILNFTLPSFAQNMQEDFLDAQNLQEDFLDAQNNARVEDDQVVAYSLAYAEQRIGDCNLVHSEGPYGENIAMGTMTCLLQMLWKCGLNRKSITIIALIYAL